MSNPDDDKPLDEIETEEAPEVEPIPEPEGETEIIETEYDIGQDNFSGAVSMELDIHKVVFSVSAIGVMLFVFLTLAFQNEVEPMFIGLRDWLTSNLDWFFSHLAIFSCLSVLGLSFRLWAKCGWAGQRPRRISAISAGSRCCSLPGWASG
ncbi:BCCT family betaine/carnitine transporter [Roseinatronobacter bogoriensis subsp. barguzinensis]|nr:BCCT family betaine/carnitine transporter [Rhodobaca barguzinensis]